MELIRDIMGFIVGGGLVTIVTLRINHRKAKTQAKKEEMELAQMYIEEFNKNIKEPLQKEIKCLKNEVSKFRKAIEKTKACKFSNDCPVINELQNQQNNDNERANDK